MPHVSSTLLNGSFSPASGLVSSALKGPFCELNGSFSPTSALVSSALKGPFCQPRPTGLGHNGQSPGPALKGPVLGDARMNGPFRAEDSRRRPGPGPLGRADRTALSGPKTSLQDFQSNVSGISHLRHACCVQSPVTQPVRRCHVSPSLDARSLWNGLSRWQASTARSNSVGIAPTYRSNQCQLLACVINMENMFVEQSCPEQRYIAVIGRLLAAERSAQTNRDNTRMSRE